MHPHSRPSHHHAPLADPGLGIDVPLPQPSPDAVRYAEYGDTPGSLGWHRVGGDQVVPSGFIDFVRATMTSPDRVYATLSGDAELLRWHALGGNDTIEGLAGTIVAVGDARVIRGEARGGDDTIQPNATFLALFGDAFVMAEQATGGNDVMRGGGGITARPFAANDIYGDAYAMLDRSRGGDDVITGGGSYPSARNQLYGDAHTLSGHARAGNDTIISGTYANNDMWGDAAVIEGGCVTTGDDVFVIRPISAANRIHDFEPGKDLIDLTAYAEIRSFEDLQARFEITEEGTHVEFSRSGGQTSPLVVNALTVLGQYDLRACDFLLA
jgi:hypothetical protein